MGETHIDMLIGLCSSFLPFLLVLAVVGWDRGGGCPFYLLGRPAAMIHKWFRSKVISLSSGSPPVAAMDRSKVISLFLLFPDGLLQWKDPKWSPWSKFVEESKGPFRKASFGLLAKRTGFLAGWVPTSLPHSWWLSSRPSILGFPRLVGLLAVLLLRHLLVLLHLLSGWASLHPGEELLRGSWEDSEVAATVRFTCFTKSWVGQVACALQLKGTR